MKASRQVLSILNSPAKFNVLYTQLIKDIQKPGNQMLYEFHNLEHPDQSIRLADWLNENKPEYAETVYQTLLKATINPRVNTPVDANTFVNLYRCHNPTLFELLKKNQQLSDLQKLIIETNLPEGPASAFLKIFSQCHIPLNEKEILQLLSMPQLLNSLFQENNNPFLQQLLDDNTFTIINTAHEHQINYDLLKPVWEKNLTLVDQLDLFCQIKQFPLLHKYIQTFHATLSAEERFQLYTKIALFDLSQLEQFLIHENELDTIVTLSAFKSLPFFKKLLDYYHEDGPRLLQWSRLLATKKLCPLHPFIMLREYGVDLSYIDETTQTHLMHLAAESENEELIKFLLCQQGTQSLSAYHKHRTNPTAKSVIEIVQEKKLHRIESLLKTYGYDVPGCSHKPISPTENPFEKLYTIFCGGGIKARAFSGAIREYIKAGLINLDVMQGTAGASAGAIAALLFSLKCSIEEAEQTLLTFDLNELLDYDRSKFDFRMIEDVASVASKAVKGGFTGGNIASLALKWITGSKEMSSIQGLADLVSQNGGGICPGHRITEWFANILKDRLRQTPLGNKNPMHITFSDIASLTTSSGKPYFKDLRIIVVNISTGRTEILSAERTPNVTIVSALRASTSIPIVFAPAKLLWRIENGSNISYEEGKDKYLDGGTGNNYPFYAYMDKDPKHHHTQGFYLADEDEVDHFKKGDFFRPFKESDENTSFYQSLYQFMFGQQDAILASDIVRENTLFIPIPKTFSPWNFGNPELQQLLDRLGSSSAIEKISLRKAHQYIPFTPYTFKLIGKINCLHFDSHRNEIVLTPPNVDTFFKNPVNREYKLLPLEILKLYARAQESELKYLAQIINPNTPDKHGLTALHIAYAFELNQVIRRLLIANANKRSIWQRPYSNQQENITPKDCKYDRERFQEIFLQMGVPEYFKQGDVLVQLSEKERAKQEIVRLKQQLQEDNRAKKSLRESMADLEKQLRQQESFALSLLKLSSITNVSEKNVEDLFSQFQSILKSTLQTNNSEEKQLRQDLTLKHNRIKQLERVILQKEEDIRNLRQDYTVLNYHKGQSDIARELSTEHMKEFQAQLEKKQLRVEELLREQQQLQGRIKQQASLLKDFQNQYKRLIREINENPVNRLKWRNTHPYYSRILLPRIKALTNEIRKEVEALNRTRHNLIFKILCPILSFVFYLKVKQKEAKLRGLDSVLERLQNDNHHSGRTIINEVTDANKQLYRGIFSRSREILDRVAQFEESHCNYTLS